MDFDMETFGYIVGLIIFGLILLAVATTDYDAYQHWPEDEDEDEDEE